MAIRSLAYIRVESPDLEAWRSFGADILGMQVAPGSADEMLLRIDDRPWRIRVEKGETSRYLCAGLEYPSQAAFDAGIAGLRKAGVALTEGSYAEAQARHVNGFVRCTDPSGNQLELCWGNIVAGTPFISPQGVSGFVTGELGMGHVVLPAPQFDPTYAFYTELLGFADSDEMRIHVPGGPEKGLGMKFLHASGPRHHAVAIAEFPAPSGLIHTMVEVASLDDVGLALDRALAAGTHLSSTLGKHTNDKMVSFYIRTPGGFDIEYGCGGIQAHDWSVVTPTTTIKEDLWGHKWDFGQ
jgi:3,4-dihydroxy-9,10-secoandrosta-1,3,5(10)-triene-9,17-dione 4,5-dioxygenase